MISCFGHAQIMCYAMGGKCSTMPKCHPWLGNRDVFSALPTVICYSLLAWLECSLAAHGWLAHVMVRILSGGPFCLTSNVPVHQTYLALKQACISTYPIGLQVMHVCSGGKCACRWTGIACCWASSGTSWWP